MKNYQAPDEKGFFGEHGGLYVSETLIPALQELADAYKAAKNDPSFWEEFHRDLKHYVGRPSALYHAERLTEHLREKAQAAGVKTFSAVTAVLRFGNPLAHAAPLLRHVVPSLPAIAGDIADPEAQEIAYECTPVGGVAALGRIQRAAERGLGRITSPVTVFHSAQDAVVPEASHRALLRGLTRAPVDVVPLPRSRHMATLDLDLPLLIAGSRDAVTRAVRRA